MSALTRHSTTLCLREGSTGSNLTCSSQISSRMAIEQQPTLQDAEAAISAGKHAEGERILKQILEGKSSSES